MKRASMTIGIVAFVLYVATGMSVVSLHMEDARCFLLNATLCLIAAVGFRALAGDA